MIGPQAKIPVLVEAEAGPSGDPDLENVAWPPHTSSSKESKATRQNDWSHPTKNEQKDSKLSYFSVQSLKPNA